VTLLASGSPVRIEMQKWGGRPHWSYDARWLGTDEHGTWVGIPTGTHMQRPGASYTNPTPQVCLLPDAAGWVATFHAKGSTMKLYVDMSTPVIWHGTTAVCVDLDVIRRLDDTVEIDDEDEFAEHRVAFGYPPEVVALAEGACADVARLVGAWAAPFDADTHRRWLDLLATLGQ